MSIRIIHADVMEGLASLADTSVHAVITSPPYWQLRDYGYPGQIGLEPTVEAHIERLVAVFREVRRVLRDDGCLMLNYGDMWAAGGRGGGGSYMAERGKGGTGSWGAQDGKTGWRSPVSGLKAKDMVLMPERLVLALQADGWWVRDRIIWAKPNPMPSSVKDRCTPAHEIVWHLAKSARYYWDAEAIAEPAMSPPTKMPDNWDTGPGAHGAIHRAGREKGRKNETQADRRRAGFNDRWDEGEANGEAPLTRNRRNVWTIPTEPFPEAHFATFPTELVRLLTLATCPPGGTVLDPFGGSGTVGLVADRQQRHAILIEANPDYVAIARDRVTGESPLFAEVTP